VNVDYKYINEYKVNIIPELGNIDKKFRLSF